MVSGRVLAMVPVGLVFRPVLCPSMYIVTLESTMVVDPAASFICQTATGRSMTALAGGAAIASTPAGPR
jgi:hypothetical protein